MCLYECGVLIYACAFVCVRVSHCVSVYVCTNVFVCISVSVYVYVYLHVTGRMYF